MALVNVTRKPVSGTARQFDGTLQAFLDIIGARPKANLTAACRFSEAGDFAVLRLDGPNTAVTLNVGDWVVFPADPSQPPVGLTNAQAIAEWQTA